MCVREVVLVCVCDVLSSHNRIKTSAKLRLATNLYQNYARKVIGLYKNMNGILGSRSGKINSGVAII